MVYDCLILGGGPAGLSAAIYMGRFLRRTVILDAGEGRSSFEQINDNYLGFPDGVKVKDLRELSKQQAERFGVQFCDCSVERMEKSSRNFIAHCDAGKFEGKTVIICTGVRDIWPDVPNVEDYVGKSLFWCITCDGFRAINKKVVLLGNDDEAATTACQFQLYTNDVTFISSEGKIACTDEKLQDMATHKVRQIHQDVVAFEGASDKLNGVRLKNGELVQADLVFSALGCVPNNQPAKDLGVKCSTQGYVISGEDGKTNVPGVFCAGDLSLMHTHQVVSAAHEGAEAAQTANYYLYAEYQKE